MSSRSVPDGKADIVVRVDLEMKEALMERARVEHRSVGNLVAHAAAVYLGWAKGVAA